ncbi:MAG: patatin-like phospholipase family protein [Arenimonas sp.]
MAGETALCLSGGGYRAAIFHLGAMLRLHEREELHGVEMFSAVSGGSIALAWLAQCFLSGRDEADEGFDEWCGRIDFGAVVLEPFRTICARDLRSAAVLATLTFNWFWPSPRVRLLERGYQRFLGETTLAQLPASPAFVFCATDLSFGCNWEFSRRRVGDFQAGYLREPGAIALAAAVAASSCFPPLFGPVRLSWRAGDFTGGKQSGSELLDRIELSDGGVYDNMATEPAIKRCGRILVSDAGAPFGFEAGRHYLRRLLRYAAVVGNQAVALRKRLFHAGRAAGEFEGAYWHLGEERDAGADGYSLGLCRDVLARVRTDLDRFTPAEFEILVNHGYFSCEAGLLADGLVPAGDPPTRWPYPDWEGEAPVLRALRHSHRRFLHARWWQN